MPVANIVYQAMAGNVRILNICVSKPLQHIHLTSSFIRNNLNVVLFLCSKL